MRYTDEQLLDRVKSLPTFQGWPKSVMEVAVRSKADVYDAFDDKIYTYDCRSGKPVFVMVRNGTTNAGSFGLKHFDTYNHAGCAVLKSDTIVYDSHQYGLHKGKPAYRQVKGFPYFRDNNRNERAEEIGLEYNDIIYANIHRAGQNSTVIKNWSTACIVTANLSRFMEWLNWMIKNKKPSVSLCILKEF